LSESQTIRKKLSDRVRKKQEVDGRLLATSASQSIPIADRNAPLPLSWQQNRLWFIDRFDAASSQAYHMFGAFRLNGRLDKIALGLALDRVMARHECLRTSFAVFEGKPIQNIGPKDVKFTLQFLDWGGLNSKLNPQNLEEWFYDESRKPFNLKTGPLIRGNLLKLSESEHILFLNMHHILSDAWSVGVLLRELCALYSAYKDGCPDPLPALNIQYADYAAWQRSCIDESNQISFWRAHLEGAPELLNLPIDYTRPEIQTFRGATIPICISQELTAQLRALSKSHRATLFIALLTGWGILLGRLSAQKNIVIGTPVANRALEETKVLIGFFVNTIALHIDLNSAQTVGGLLGKVRDSMFETYGHQHFPFEKLVETLQPTRSLAHNALFQTMFAFDNAPGDRAVKLEGIDVERIDLAKSTATFDISLSLEARDDEIAGKIEYSTDLFKEESIVALGKRYVSLLTEMVRDQYQTIKELPIITRDEQRIILEKFNSAQRDYPSDGLIHELFASWALDSPNSVALVYGKEKLTYAELNRRANVVAQRLIGAGVCLETRVAIFTERGFELIIGILGALKAGAAYVPLDPTYPKDRLTYILDDSEPLVVLTHTELESSLPQTNAKIICLNDKSAFVGCKEHCPEVTNISSRSLAYIIYTSGSTGQPKGVMVEHRNVVSLIFNSQTFKFKQSQSFTQCINQSFDPSVHEIFGALLNGAKLVFVSSSTLLNETEFMQLLVEQSIRGVFIPPVLFNQYANTLASLDCALDFLVIGGETADKNAVEKVLTNNSIKSLLNCYGPTETTVCASAHRCTLADFNDHSSTLSIGKPLSNVRVYVVDEFGKLAPPGVEGELCIAGSMVARGYWQLPELTAQRFVEDPFVTKATSSQMYHTGDIGRWRTDGSLEYIGRNDSQIKIRGFRIELGEIESRLGDINGVKDAVVVVRQIMGDKSLAAYIRPELIDQEHDPLSASLLSHKLGKFLPNYMIPSAFVLIDEYPLTPNGKIDQKALSELNQRKIVDHTIEPPIGETEELLAAIWMELLGIEQIGRYDSFFDLGGHSLLAVRMGNQIEQDLNVTVELKDIFTHQSIKSICELIESR